MNTPTAPRSHVTTDTTPSLPADPTSPLQPLAAVDADAYSHLIFEGFDEVEAMIRNLTDDAAYFVLWEHHTHRSDTRLARVALDPDNLERWLETNEAREHAESPDSQRASVTKSNGAGSPLDSNPLRPALLEAACRCLRHLAARHMFGTFSQVYRVRVFAHKGAYVLQTRTFTVVDPTWHPQPFSEERGGTSDDLELSAAVSRAICHEEHLVVDGLYGTDRLETLLRAAISETVAKGAQLLIVSANAESIRRLLKYQDEPLLPSGCTLEHLRHVRDRRRDEKVRRAHVLLTDYRVLGAAFAFRTAREEDVVLPAPDVVILDDALEGLEQVRRGLGFRLGLENLRPVIDALELADQMALQNVLRAQATRFFDNLARHRRAPHHQGRLDRRDVVPYFDLLDALQEAFRVFDDMHLKETAAQTTAPPAAAVLESPGWLSHAATCQLAMGHIRDAMELRDFGRVFFLEEDHEERGVLCAEKLEAGDRFGSWLFPRANCVIVTGPALSFGGRYNLLRDALRLPERVRELRLAREKAQLEHHLIVPAGFPSPGRGAWPEEATQACAEVARKAKTAVKCLLSSANAVTLLKQHLERTPYVALPSSSPQPARVPPYHQVLVGRRTDPNGRPSVLRLAMSMETPRCMVIDRLPFIPSGDPVLAALKEFVPDWQDRHARFPASVAFRCQLLQFLERQREPAVIVVLDPRLLERPYGPRFLEGLGGLRVSRSLRAIPKLLTTVDY